MSQGHPAGVPGGFQKIYVVFSYVPFLLPITITGFTFRISFWIALPHVSIFRELIRVFVFAADFGPDVMQSGFGVNFYLGPANFRKIAGEF